MILDESTIKQLSDALHSLQEDDVSLSEIARDVGGKSGWIHRLKNDCTGNDLWRLIARLNNYLLEHYPDYYGTSCNDSKNKNNNPRGVHSSTDTTLSVPRADSSPSNEGSESVAV